jgi:hypothetical protein
MTDRDKKIAALVGLFVIILLLLLWRRPVATVASAGGDVQLGNVSFGGVSYIPGSYPPILLPSFGDDDYSLSAIGACCADCSTQGPAVLRQGPTFVYNEAARGNNVYVYIPPKPPKPTSSATFYQR